MASATRASGTTSPDGDVRKITNAASENAVWYKVCALDDLMTSLEGAASAVAGLALWIEQNEQDSAPKYVTTGLLHVAEDIVDNHLPGIREWSDELGELARMFMPNDPLIALERELEAAERLYGDTATAADTGPVKDKAKAAAANKAASERIDELLQQMADTPVTSIQGVAVAARCMMFLNEQGWNEQHNAMARSILRWAGERTGRNETVGGLVVRAKEAAND